MAGDTLIDAYLVELDARLGGVPDRCSVIDEVADHLWEKVDRLMASGHSTHEAQRHALTEFGAPDLVGRAFASAAHGGASVPTKFTRLAGWAGVVSAGWVLLWVALVLSVSLAGDWEPDLPAWLVQGNLSAATVVILTVNAGVVVALLGIAARYGALRWGLATVGTLLVSHFAWWWFGSAQGRLFAFEDLERYRWPFLVLDTVAMVGAALLPVVVSRSRWAVPLAVVGLVGLTVRLFGAEIGLLAPLGMVAMGLASFPLAREVPVVVDQPDDLATA